jgi:hypothetical protein
MLIHTIELESGAGARHKDSRKSASRHYQACIVATVTQAAVRADTDKRASLVKALDEQLAHSAALQDKLGMTVADAQARYEQLRERWYRKYSDTLGRVHESTGAMGNRLHELATDEMVKGGFENPYDRTGSYALVDLGAQIDTRQRQLRDWKNLTLGNQRVLSWHTTAALAHKAMAGSYCRGFVERGHQVQVRTDLSVRETKKRSKP